MADNILRATIQVTAPGVQQVFSTVAGGAKQTADQFKVLGPIVSKFGTDVAGIVPQVAQVSESLIRIVPPAQQAGNALDQLAQNIAGIDPSGAIASAQQRVGASIDKMAASAIAAITPLSKLEQQVQAFGGGVAAFSSSMAIIPKVLNQIPPAVNNSLTGFVRLSKSVQDLEAQIIRLKSGLVSGINVDSFNRITRAVSLAEARIKSLNSIGNPLKPITGGANQASFALLNMGRVIQDAPFGILGIANNLNPLVESLQRASVAAKAAGTSLGVSLLQSLKGPGGLGIAISVASTALLLFSNGFQSFSKKVKQAKEESDKFKETIDGIFSSVAKEAAEVGSLIAVLSAETETRERKLAAIKELQKIQPDVFNNLKLEGSAVIGLDNAYKAYLENLKTVIAAKIKQAQLEDLIAKLLKAQGVTLTGTEKQLIAGAKAISDFASKSEEGATLFGKGQEKIRNDSEKTTKKLESDINTLLKELTELSKGIKIKIDDPKVDKIVDKIIAEGKRLAAQFGNLAEIHLSVLPIFSELDTKAEALKKAKEIIKNVNAFFNDFSSSQRALKLVIPFQAEPFLIPPDKSPEKLLQSEITEILKSVALIKPVKFDAKFDFTLDLAKKVDDLKTKLNELTFSRFGITLDDKTLDPALQKVIDIQRAVETTADTLINLLTPAFQDLFSAIASGTDGLKSFFDTLKNQIQQLITKLIAAAVAAAILNALIPGSIGFLKIFGKLLGFERGGRPPVGKASVVGEGGHEIFKPDVGRPILVGVGGPHLFAPDRAGTIIPNYKVRDYSKLVSTDKVTSQSLVARYSDSDKVKEISNSISRIVTTVLDKVAQFQSTTLDKVASFHSSVSSSFEKVVGWRDSVKERETVASKEIRYVESNTGLKEIYKLFSSDVKDKYTQLTTASNSKEFYSVAALKEISNTLAKVFEYSTASTETGKVERTTSRLDTAIHSAFESTYSGLIEKLASIYKSDTSNVSREKEDKTTEKNFHSAFASNNSYEKTISSAFENIKEIFSSTSDKKHSVRESTQSDFQSLVTSATSSIKELNELFTSYSNDSLIKNYNKETSHSESSTVFESIKSFTSSIVQKFTSTIERLLSSVVTNRLQPIPVSQITNITRAASTLNNLTKNVQFRAAGGPVSRNAPTIVGEKGWELFTPKVSGHIIPHHKVNEYLKNLYKSTATEKELRVFRSTRNIKDLNLSKIFNRRITNISELTHKELSTIIGKQFGGFRAGGGFVGGGSTIAVGERNFELFVPNTGASIITNNNNAGGVGHVSGGTLKVEGNIRIAGSDLIAVISNASRSQSRLS